MSYQAPSHVILIRPHFFTPNPATVSDNAFQTPHPIGSPGPSSLITPNLPNPSATAVARHARDEVTGLAHALASVGVETTVFDDFSASTPDSVFPNNWFSTHPDGSVVLYPMYAPNRRAERREDVIARLTEEFQVRKIIDYSHVERDGRFLEGTGAMVLDHDARIAYACRSKRLSPTVFADFCADRGYTPVLFDAVDSRGVPVYHTNVLMSVGAKTAVIGSGMIRDEQQRNGVVGQLRDTGKTVVEIEESQVQRFLGNCIELTGSEGQVLAMSQTAASALSHTQRESIQRHVEILAVLVPTVERAGGSVRCMIAGNHLQRKAVDPQHSHGSSCAPAAMSARIIPPPRPRSPEAPALRGSPTGWR